MLIEPLEGENTDEEINTAVAIPSNNGIVSHPGNNQNKIIKLYLPNNTIVYHNSANAHAAAQTTSPENNINLAVTTLFGASNIVANGPSEAVYQGLNTPVVRWNICGMVTLYILAGIGVILLIVGAIFLLIFTVAGIIYLIYYALGIALFGFIIWVCCKSATTISTTALTNQRMNP